MITHFNCSNFAFADSLIGSFLKFGGGGTFGGGGGGGGTRSDTNN